MYVRASLRRTYIPRYTSTETTPNGSAHFFNFNTCELVIQTKHLNQMPHRQPFFNKTKCAAGKITCRCGVATSDQKTCLAAKFVQICHHVVAFCLQEQKKCTDLNPTLLYIWILRTVGKFARKNKNASAQRLLPADVLERWLQVCCVKITFTLLQTNCFASTTANLMKCPLNWIPLRIRVRSRNVTQSHLKHGVGCFLNEPEFSVESNLQGISWNLLLWNETIRQ